MRRSVLVLAVAAALVALGQPAQAGPGLSFTITDPELTFTTTAADQVVYADAHVTNTGRRPIVLADPATVAPLPPPDQGTFADTQAGSCWQAYEALGHAIPGGASCTIQVGYRSGPFVGHVSSTLVVYQCQAWTLNPQYGFIQCSKTVGSVSVPLQAEALATS